MIFIAFLDVDAEFSYKFWKYAVVWMVWLQPRACNWVPHPPLILAKNKIGTSKLLNFVNMPFLTIDTHLFGRSRLPDGWDFPSPWSKSSQCHDQDVPDEPNAHQHKLCTSIYGPKSQLSLTWKRVKDWLEMSSESDWGPSNLVCQQEHIKVWKVLHHVFRCFHDHPLNPSMVE